ncbi:uncharacterized protein PFL1_03264 [Pseudozyma flocculosa PF-1]|uniref:Homeobox domain-containing protein n=2 Tax=Pseudozyma flocculosa TaxID=84751 RepID=A0A5C3F8B5_9BASI|nr:uncharacterized protein PFL1_03264 [Pseudozyma flocculosa PF-1]EPQ28974.1 hypothetical protein PFL1_03264 [Pseudozyma flocculosa PF-1]SPO39967.1 uncharacterized protein PSFLO_05449 [Pseudozyma flocculosa]
MRVQRDTPVITPNQEKAFTSVATSCNSTDTLQCHLMRRYFLDHLDDPYPSQDEKDDIVRQTNAAIRQHPTYQSIKHTKRGEINDERLMLWFINARRRSGWQALKREFGGDDRVRTGRIIRAFLREQGRPVKGRPGDQGDSLAELIAPGRDPMSDEVQQRMKKLADDIETIELYLRHGIKQKVRGWMQDVIEGAKEDQRREKTKKAGVKERKASTAATKAKSKPTAKTKAKPAPSKPRPAVRQGTRASARIARSTTRAVAYQEQSEAGSDDEPPMTARPSQQSFESARMHDLDSRSLYGNALGLGLPSTARYHPAARDSSNGSLTSTDSSQASTSFDPQGSRCGYSRASSVTSYSSFDEALEALQPETAPPTAKRIIRPLPSRSPPSALLYTDFADLAAADLGPRRPISSSPTNSQEVHDRFIHEQPSDSDCSPAALPLLLPRIPA